MRTRIGLQQRTTCRRGFTLLETALAMIIVMVGVVAMIEAQSGFIRINSWSSHEATATYLANELRERMRSLPRHDPVSGITIATGGGGQQTIVGIGRENGEVTVADFDDIDDYDGVEFGVGGNFDGPIDAFGTVIPEVNGSGAVVINPQTGQPLPLDGWSQAVTVEKVDPYDFAVVRAWTYVEPPSGTFAGRAVDKFPLRVTVRVRYQGGLEPQPRTIVTMSWIVPAN